ncbi:MAG: hypothetical protein MUE54_14970 [Anaerolineae bacterium]|jgi:hypothetical protein|nr:hypothetical protein [Anaerolineae bacterium]
MRSRFILIAIMMLFVVVIPTYAQSDDVDVDIPDIPAGQQVTITYRVRVNDRLPIDTRYIIDQGRIIIGGETLLTDDPRLTGNTDPTLTLAGLSAKALPATGEIPWWRNVLIIGSVALVMAMAVTLLLGKRPKSD